MNKFYIGASPIGGIHDITLRTLQVIKEADYIVCELIHTVKTTIEKGNWETNAKLIEYCVDFVGDEDGARSPHLKNHGEIKDGIQEEILELIKQGNKMIYLPERGSVGVEDPGLELMAFLKKNGVEIEVLPGVSSVIACLIVSGIWPRLESNRAWTFQPLVDLEGDKLEKTIEQYKDSYNLLICQIHDAEMLDGLKFMAKHYGRDRQVAMCIDVSLPSEKVYLTNLGYLVDNFDPQKYHNCYSTIVVDGKNNDGQL